MSSMISISPNILNLTSKYFIQYMIVLYDYYNNDNQGFISLLIKQTESKANKYYYNKLIIHCHYKL